MKVIKHSGSVDNFNRAKLEASLRKSGASEMVVQDVISKIEHQLFDGITTKAIYKEAFRLLRKSANAHAARYNLRTGIQQLGPAGFFFEKFIARVLEVLGYETEINLNLRGTCVSHEVDIIAKKDGKCMMVECKFHSSQDNRSDVKVPMYILSRFNDLNKNDYQIFNGINKITECTIVTNNKFTSDAIAFANCSGIGLLSWDFPDSDNLRVIIDRHQLYPITCLTTISAAEKEKLLILGLLLARDLIDNPSMLERIGISESRIVKIMRETSSLLNLIK